MTATNTLPAASDNPAPTPAAGRGAGPTASAHHPHDHGATLPRVAGYLALSLVRQLTNWPFLLFVVAMPVVMYAMFSAMWGDVVLDDGTSLAAILMTMLATYGGLGAAMHAGNAIQSERSTGWLRQLMLTPLRPVEYLLVKAVVAVAVLIPAVGIVYGYGAARGVRLDATAWLTSYGLLLLALLPMIVLGVVIGVYLKPEAANPATTLIMLALSMLGGLWFNLDAAPQVMRDIAQQLPSYWAMKLAQWPILGGDFPTRAWIVLSLWTVVLGGLGVVGYRRALRTSKH